MQNLQCCRLQNGMGALSQSRYLILVGCLFYLGAAQAFAQVPLPGNQTTVDANQYAAKSVVQSQAPQSGSAPVPGQWQAAAGKAASAYQQLPLTQSEAEMQVGDMKAAMASNTPPNAQESLFQLGEWLADMAEAHSKMSAAFSKREATKGEAQAERLSAQKFNMLRNQIQLLKAELLMRQHRYPEALQPLVDIVVAEPTSVTGQAAYQHLREIGFSQVLPGIQQIQSTPSVGDKVASPKTDAEVVPGTQITRAGVVQPNAGKRVVTPKNWTANKATAHYKNGVAAVPHAPIYSLKPKAANTSKNKDIAGADKPAQKVWISGTPMGR